MNSLIDFKPTLIAFLANISHACLVNLLGELGFMLPNPYESDLCVWGCRSRDHVKAWLVGSIFIDSMVDVSIPRIKSLAIF